MAPRLQALELGIEHLCNYGHAWVPARAEWVGLVFASRARNKLLRNKSV